MLQTVPILDSVRALRPSLPPPPAVASARRWLLRSLDMKLFNPLPPPIVGSYLIIESKGNDKNKIFMMEGRIYPYPTIFFFVISPLALFLFSVFFSFLFSLFSFLFSLFSFLFCFHFYPYALRFV